MSQTRSQSQRLPNSDASLDDQQQQQQHQTSTTTASASPPNGNEAASKLAEALDDFLGDVERKFKGISEEILARLDEMAERCDRLEGELMRKEVAEGTGSSNGGVVLTDGK